MRRVLQHIVELVCAAFLDRADLCADRDERVAEAVELRLRLALGRLDHERARDGPRHRRRVEAVVHHALRDVVDLDARRLVERPHVENELVCAQPVLVRVEHAEVRLQTLRHVVRVEDRDLGRRAQALRAHHRDVHPRDEQDRRAAVGRGRNRADRVTARRVRTQHRVTGQEVLQVRSNADRAHARSAAAVRDTEGLVQVEVAHVGADVARAREADLRVHVRAVHVDLSAVLVHDRASLLDVLLEDAVRRRVGDHQGPEIFRVRLRLLAEVGEVDVALAIALDRNDRHACDDRGGGVRAVRRGRDEAHIAVRLAAVLVVRADDEHARVLALRASVRLEAHRREARRLAEPRLERAEHLGVSEPLLSRCKRVDLTELGPGHGDHLARRVELHRARAERDHRVDEAQVLRYELVDVAEHLVLAVVAVEHLVLHEGRGAREHSGNAARRGFDARRGDGLLTAGEHLKQRVEIRERG